MLRITARAESLLSQKRDEAALAISAETATGERLNELFLLAVDHAYPLVQALYRLTRDTVTLQELAGSAINSSDPEVLAMIERRAALVFGNAREASDRIARLETSDDYGRVSAGLEALHARLMGSDGLFFNQREYVATSGELTERHEALAATEARYVDLLGQVRRYAEQQNEAAKAHAEQVLGQALSFIGNTILAGVMVGIILTLALIKRIIVPITRMTDSMSQLAGGDLAVPLPPANRADEIGEMAAALQVFRDNAMSTRAIMDERERERAIREKRTERVTELCAQHERSMTGLMLALNNAGNQMLAMTQQMSTIVQTTGEQAAMAAQASQEVHTKVQIAAAATEQLSSSAAQIDTRALHSAQVAQKAAEETEYAAKLVRELHFTSSEIGEVAHMIGEIATRTNLLALHATIEAAGAGAAGGGFGVVASEIKHLAGQTTTSTADIDARVAAIQNATKQAVEAIASVHATIGEMREIADFVAHTIKAQFSATAEIVTRSSLIATSSTQLNANAEDVRSRIQLTAPAADEAVRAAMKLNRQADELRAEIDSFLVNVRAA